MSKKHFIALANVIKIARKQGMFQNGEVRELANFCKSQNSDFKTDRWFDFIDDKCGQNGGAIKA